MVCDTTEGGNDSMERQSRLRRRERGNEMRGRDNERRERENERGFAKLLEIWKLLE